MRIDSDHLRERFNILMARPDPLDLRGVIGPNVQRGFRYTQCGNPDRRSEVGIPLLIRWYQRRIVMNEERETWRS
jgi:hypothetical protein